MKGALWVSAARHAALTVANQTLPAVATIEALVDTGATSTVVEPAILQALQLSPIGQVATLTPSTGGSPVMCDQYDVSLTIFGPTTSSPRFNLPNLLVIAAMPNSLSTQGIDALIGRDVLGHCLMHYNGTAGFFTLAY